MNSKEQTQMKLSVKTTLSVMTIAFILLGAFLLLNPKNEIAMDDSLIESRGNEQETKRQHALSTESSAVDNLQATAEDNFIENTIASSIQEVALAFKAQSRYPHYSIPVVDQALAASPKAFEATKVSMPTFDDAGEALPFTISAATDKLEYARGETITVQVTIDGADDSTFIDATALIKPTQDASASSIRKTLAPNNNVQHSLQTSINSGDVRIKGDAQEFLAVIELNINGSEHITSVPFVISRVSAELLQVGKVEQIDDFLAITLDYRVDQSGYYFVTAYLDDAQSNKALLSLQAEGKMREGNDELVLKAHHQALKDAGSQGPYQLRIMRSFRGAKPGESNDVPTAISQQQYDIPDFAFDGYADLPYSDLMVERRIKALMSLGSDE